ncbi:MULTISPECIES: hypothetical protein [unclassified Aminobacter]|jgi:hypothetical protein|uniref:hypothetical protein n=1 Tax=unclassified Aminobacter TaxID=2644704 RepID=UPI0004664A69|nr:MULTISPECIES: hypothetical protein [unclassified Aminobacter]TWH24433.1 hypothetical protein L611_000700000450 [Aminobacter sp. J15]
MNCELDLARWHLARAAQHLAGDDEFRTNARLAIDLLISGIMTVKAPLESSNVIPFPGLATQRDADPQRSGR